MLSGLSGPQQAAFQARVHNLSTVRTLSTQGTAWAELTTPKLTSAEESGAEDAYGHIDIFPAQAKIHRFLIVTNKIKYTNAPSRFLALNFMKTSFSTDEDDNRLCNL
uniref:Uncharacterized protein n=1 Tax=Romanomermis culicivorax TaxID=13658 RepID=A0A915IHJ2_ROMCU